MEELTGIALRVSVMYFYALTIVRLSGRRTIGAAAPLDFVVTLIIGDMFDDVFWAEIPLAQGIVGMTTIAVLHIVVAYAGYTCVWVDHLLGSNPVAIIRDGRFEANGLRQERLARGEVLSQLRLLGVESIAQVRAAFAEPSGAISALLREEAKPAEKQDLPVLKETLR